MSTSIPDRNTLVKYLGDHLPQLQGTSPKSSTRNVALICLSWFDPFLSWLRTPEIFNPPGPIDNTELDLALASFSTDIPFPAFDFVELSVWRVLLRIFGGGNTIIRPYMENPDNGCCNVVLIPLLFTITLEDGSTADLHVDPEWSTSGFREYLHRKLGINPSETTFMSMNREFEIKDVKDLDMGQVFDLYGKDLVIKESRLPLRSLARKSSFPRISPSQFNYFQEVVDHTTILKTSQAYSSALNMFTAFIHAFSQATGIVQKCLEIENEEVTLWEILAKHVRDCVESPQSVLVPRALFADVVSRKPNPAEWRAITLHKLVRRFLKDLVESAPERDLNEIIGGTLRVEKRCACCTRGIATERSWKVLVIEHQSNFKKWSLTDAIAALLGHHATPIEKARTCAECGHQGVANEFVQFQLIPPVLVVALPRVSRQGKTVRVNDEKIWYDMTLDLSAITRQRENVFELKGVVIVGGSHGNPKFKAFAYHGWLESWVCFAETHLIQTKPQNAIIPDAASLFIYERKIN
jgi:hypothetical protein